MTKSRLIGIAAVLAYVLAGHAIARPIHPGQSVYCATRDPGNPHSRLCDYIAWSKWRERGGWDARLDDACYHNPGFVPGECGFSQGGQLSWGEMH